MRDKAQGIFLADCAQSDGHRSGTHDFQLGLGQITGKHAQPAIGRDDQPVLVNMPERITQPLDHLLDRFYS